MKHDLPRDPSAPDDAFVGRLSALAAALREDGVEPARDLWPDIERALDTTGATGRRATRYKAARTWTGAALAATVLLAIGLGVADLRPGPDVRPAIPVARDTTTLQPGGSAGSATARQGLHAVDQALNELQAALRQSPNDPDLSRLVMLIHHSRGRLLRLQAEGGVRDARGDRS
jgi:hypothetical protein